jgi:ketosteroid isomerase-like protein
VWAGEPAATPQDVLRLLMKADNASDLDGAMLAYAPDAMPLPPNEPLVSGKDAICRRYRRCGGEAAHGRW